METYLPYKSNRQRNNLKCISIAILGLLGSSMCVSAAHADASKPLAVNSIKHGHGSLRGVFPDLRVDANRDGRVDLDGKSDERLEDSRSALFLANLDDDGSRCAPGADLFKDAELGNADPEVDRRLLACNDAQDEIVNGIRDELDLARIHALPMPTVAVGAQVAVSGAPAGAIRLFIRDNGQLRAFDPATEKVPAQVLRAGLDLRLEGRDIVRDSSWDGTVRVTLSLPNGAADSVRLRVAPLLLQHTLQRSQRVLVNAPLTPISREQFDELYKDIPEYRYEAYLFNLQFASTGYAPFRDTLDAARRSAGIKPGLKELNSNGDRWTQDLFEPAYSSVPGGDGKPQVMRVVIRSAQPWRINGRVAFSLRGPDVGVVQQFTDDLPPTVHQSLNSLGNLDAVPAHTAHGVRYPNGRILLGSSETRQPDPSFAAMLAAQKAQPLLTLDTSWLDVGHVDEILQVVPAPNRRGWTLAVADPRGALELLRTAAANGNGAARLFIGRAPDRLDSLGAIEPSIDQILADANLMEDNERAAQHLDRVLAKLLDDLDLNERELIKLPVLFRLSFFTPRPGTGGNGSSGTGLGDNGSGVDGTIDGGTTGGTVTIGNLLADGAGFGNGNLLDPNLTKAQKLIALRQNLMLNQLQAGTGPQPSFGALKADVGLPQRYFAYSPNLANGLLLSSKPAGWDRGESGKREDGDGQPDWVFAYTKPDGPVVDGKDLFAQAAIEALGRVGVRPFEVDAWDWAHLGQGEVHCTTNVWRDVRPDAAWWRKRN